MAQEINAGESLFAAPSEMVPFSRQAGVLSDPAVVAPSHPRVADFTREIFHGPLRIDLATDWESGEQYYRVSVESPGTVDELAALNDRWHRELVKAGDQIARMYCLSLVPCNEAG